MPVTKPFKVRAATTESETRLKALLQDSGEKLFKGGVAEYGTPTAAVELARRISETQNLSMVVTQRRRDKGQEWDEPIQTFLREEPTEAPSPRGGREPVPQQEVITWT